MLQLTQTARSDRPANDPGPRRPPGFWEAYLHQPTAHWPLFYLAIVHAVGQEAIGQLNNTVEQRLSRKGMNGTPGEECGLTCWHENIMAFERLCACPCVDWFRRSSSRGHLFINPLLAH